MHAGYPLDAEAILLCESDGTHEEVVAEVKRMTEVMQASGATEIRLSRDDAERLKFWSGRKAAFPAVGRILPDYYCMDGTIPKKKLGAVLAGIAALSKEFGLACPNVFHAEATSPLDHVRCQRGDGRNGRSVRRAFSACIDAGGIYRRAWRGIENQSDVCSSARAS